MRILNMTQHEATRDQIAAGVVQPVRADHERVKEIITFEELPELSQLKWRARRFAELARALWESGIRFCCAFSQRDSIDETQPDGSVVKRTVFKHAGFIWKEVR